MGRAPCCEKVGLKKGRWTAEEDEILTNYIQANGEGSWRSLPKNAGLLRCGKSCRLRWINYLRTDLKRGNISAEEEDTIVKLHASFGNRWSLIATHLPGRTDNEIKNYWNSHLSRKIYRFSKVAGAMEVPQPQRKVGKTSRWAMKKNKNYTQTPKQVITQQNSESAVPPPSTPSLDSEDLCHVLEKEELIDETRTEEMEMEGKTRHKKCVEVEKETDDDISGLYKVEGFNGGCEVLCFSDMMDNCLLETCGVSTLNEERERNDVQGVGEENERSSDECPNKMDPDNSSGVNNNSIGESEEWCSLMPLGLEGERDWESIMEFNDSNNHETDVWEHKENVLTWLWKDDDWESDTKILGEIDPQRQNDMIAWFLS